MDIGEDGFSDAFGLTDSLISWDFGVFSSSTSRSSPDGVTLPTLGPGFSSSSSSSDSSVSTSSGEGLVSDFISVVSAGFGFFFDFRSTYHICKRNFNLV